MLTTVAVAALALSLQPSADPNARPRNDDVPPMTVNVYSARGVSPHLVTETLNEAGAVWNDVGITLAWRVVVDSEPQYTAAPHVVIADETVQAPNSRQTPLGWVRFKHPDDPDQEIHISRLNGMKLLQSFSGLGRPMERMPPGEIEATLGRMLGRALAHELGHFLLRSSTHTKNGLMRGNRTIREFLALGRRGFEVDPAQRAAALARIREMIAADT